MEFEQFQAQLSQQSEQLQQLAQHLALEQQSRMQLEQQLQQQHVMSSGSSSHPAPMELGSLQRAPQRNPQQPPTSGKVPYCSWHHRQGHWTADCRQRARSMRTQHPDGKAAKQ
jgi:hypothetical protein